MKQVLPALIKLSILPIVFAMLILFLHSRSQNTHVGSSEADLVRAAEPKPPMPAPAFKKAVTTLFWIGEEASGENGFISNRKSHWDPEWVKRFGGVDDPLHRKGFFPAAFRPKENPFYVALPFADTGEEGMFKPIANTIRADSRGRLTKNRWVEVQAHDKSCFGQWEDVGPFGENDFDWVFGSAAKPLNNVGDKAGLDVSPAMAECLSMDGLGTTQWRFVNEEDVPEGPWKETVTDR
jgi:hypothetical protein